MPTDDEWKQMLQDRTDLLDGLAKVTAMAARSEAQVVKLSSDVMRLTSEVKAAEDSSTYWINQFNSATAKVKTLEAKVKELESPLADLARAAAKEV